MSAPKTLCECCQCEIDCEESMCEACQASWATAPHWSPCPECGCSMYTGDTLGMCTCCPCPHEESQETAE